MGALRNPPNRQGSNMIFGTYLLDIPAFGPQAQPLPALPAATNRGWSNRGTTLTGSAPDYSRPQTEGVLAVAEVKSWWLRRRKHPARTRLRPLAAAFVPRTPTAEVVAAAPLNPLAAVFVPELWRA